MFKGFTKEGLKLLDQIAHNNNKEWFDAHKHEYEQYILEPGREFVVEMGEHLQALVPTIKAVPKINGSLFRIYRDSRFHARVDPIKTRIGIIFWQGNGKRMSSASFYLQFDPKSVMLAVGIRFFKPDMLACYREYIKVDAHREALHVIVQELTCKGYLLPEPAYKRYPKGFTKEMKHGYLALYKGMYAYSLMKPEKTFFNARFPYTAYEVYEALFDLHQWVYEMTLTLEQA